MNEVTITDDAGEIIKLACEDKSRFALTRTDKIFQGNTSVIILNKREACEIAAFILKEVGCTWS